MQVYNHHRDYPMDKWRWPNFSPREIACKGTNGLIVDEVAMDRLQTLRNALAAPIILTSAYRSPEHNRRVGGAKNSYHMRGQAFDVRMENHDPEKFVVLARAAGFRGIGYYPRSGFIHIDTGPERTWGTPFPRSSTGLAAEPEKRESIAQSATVKAVALDVAAKAGTGIAAVNALDGNAQLLVIGLVGVSVLFSAWIFRERIRAWAEGWR